MTAQLSIHLPGASRAAGWGTRRRGWPAVVFFASGTNDCGEIRGFADLAIHVGFCAAVIGPPALDELERHAGTGLQVFGDTGAYSEVTARNVAGAGFPLAPTHTSVRESITEEDWESRLAVLERVAAAFGSAFTVVAPDRVGDQETTLARLLAYRTHVRTLARRGARILLPLHSGGLGLAAFHLEASRLLGIPLVPAFPIPKARTTAHDVLRFATVARPREIHLLGVGLRSRWPRELLPLLAKELPKLRVSMDANLITSAVGRRADGTAGRRLTAAQDAIRQRGFPRAFGETVNSAWDIHADYTDCVALPSTWLGPAALRAVADALSLSRERSRHWRKDPDAFLQAPIDGPDSPSWWEHPAMEAALEAAWLRHLHRLHTAPRKAEAIRRTFRRHPAAGQFTPRHAARPRCRLKLE